METKLADQFEMWLQSRINTCIDGLMQRVTQMESGYAQLHEALGVAQNRLDAQALRISELQRRLDGEQPDRASLDDLKTEISALCNRMDDVETATRGLHKLDADELYDLQEETRSIDFEDLRSTVRKLEDIDLDQLGEVLSHIDGDVAEQLADMAEEGMDRNEIFDVVGEVLRGARIEVRP